MEIGAKRAGHERDPLVHRRPPEVAEAQIEPLGHACLPCLLRTDLEHPGRGVDADHVDARRSGRDRDAAGADAELDHRPA